MRERENGFTFSSVYFSIFSCFPSFFSVLSKQEQKRILVSFCTQCLEAILVGLLTICCHFFCVFPVESTNQPNFQCRFDTHTHARARKRKIHTRRRKFLSISLAFLSCPKFIALHSGVYHKQPKKFTPKIRLFLSICLFSTISFTLTNMFCLVFLCFFFFKFSLAGWFSMVMNFRMLNYFHRLPPHLAYV